MGIERIETCLSCMRCIGSARRLQSAAARCHRCQPLTTVTCNTATNLLKSIKWRQDMSTSKQFRGKQSALKLPQVFALGQEVAFEYQGQNFVLTVKNLMVLDRKNVQMSVTRGALVNLTAFSYEAPGPSNIKVPSTVRSLLQD